MDKIEKRKKVAAILAKKRQELGLSQEKLAEKLGLSLSTILRIEKCKFSPNADLLYMIADALEIEISLDGEKI